MIQSIDIDFDHAPAAESFETALPVKPEVVRVHTPARSFAAAPLGRTLPQSPEAEAALLGSIFVDPDDVLPKVVDARVSGASLYDHQNGAILRVILGLWADKKPINIAIVAEELKSAPEFKGSNVFAKLIQVSDGVATTAQATYFIEKVREQSLLRELIKAGTHAVEQCYSFSGGIDDFVTEIQGQIKAVVDSASDGRADELAKRAFDLKREIPKPSAIYSVAGTPICTPGNLSTIYSQAKTGKSSFLAAMIASSMTNPTSGCDTLGVAGPNYAKHAVLHFDTEQSPYDWQQLVKSSLRRAKLSTPPPWLLSYTVAGMEATKAEEFVRSAMRAAQKKFGGIHSVFIDGVADLVNDPNDPQECFPMIARLHGAAIEYNTSVISILHMNPGSDVKGRGHLGSQLERKSESNLTLKKDGDTTTVIGEGRQRGKPIPANKAPSFKWSDEAGMHVSTKTPESVVESSRTGRPEIYPFSLFKSVIPKKTDPGMQLTPLAKACGVNKPINPKQLFNVLKRWEEEGCIEVIETPQGRRYRQAI